jgi:hypothetical protein
MNISPPPDEEWVIAGYMDSGGHAQEFRADWTIIGLPPEANAVAPDVASPAAAALGLDLEGDTFQRINKLLFAQHMIRAKRQLEGVRARAAASIAFGASADDVAAAESSAVAGAVSGTQSTMPDIFAARAINSGGNDYAYVRIFTFSVGDDVAFVNEFLRLIELPTMPKTGLIIDVRGNGGGLIWAGERLLQLLTPKTIEPCRLQFINTRENATLCEKLPSLQDWAPSLERAPETGATFSSAFPITPAERCNDIGQRYYGPVLLITDARCYSTTDIFSAGFQDHKIGPILGVDNNTGAGGANVWTLELIRQFFASAQIVPPLEQLPKGASMRVAIRRTLRVGDQAGTELEELGVKPNVEHQLTANDVLNDNPDLLAKSAQTLAVIGEPVRRFEVLAARGDGKLLLRLATANVDYVDVIANGRPRGSKDVMDGVVKFALPESQEFRLPAEPMNIELRGYAGGKLVCCRRLQA